MYTEQDVIDYLSNTLIIRKTRERTYIDPRNYLLGLLAYKYNYTEEAIATLFKIERSSVNHAKRHPYSMISVRDSGFLTNVKEVMELFPYDFPEPKHKEFKSHYEKKDKIEIFLDREMHDVIKQIARTGKTTVPRVLKNLITTSFKVMDRMSKEYQSNPNYQNGYFWGKNTARFIENSNYRSLENAIIVKEQLLLDFEEHFKWDMSNKDYAETRGAIDAFRDMLSNNSESNEQGSDSEGGS